MQRDRCVLKTKPLHTHSHVTQQQSHAWRQEIECPVMRAAEGGVAHGACNRRRWSASLEKRSCKRGVVFTFESETPFTSTLLCKHDCNRGKHNGCVCGVLRNEEKSSEDVLQCMKAWRRLSSSRRVSQGYGKDFVTIALMHHKRCYLRYSINNRLKEDALENP